MSKFINHPDTMKDYNYLVDTLEDEHIKTSIFTPRFLDKLERNYIENEGDLDNSTPLFNEPYKHRDTHLALKTNLNFVSLN